MGIRQKGKGNRGRMSKRFYLSLSRANEVMREAISSSHVRRSESWRRDRGSRREWKSQAASIIRANSQTLAQRQTDRAQLAASKQPELSIF